MPYTRAHRTERFIPRREELRKRRGAVQDFILERIRLMCSFRALHALSVAWPRIQVTGHDEGKPLLLLFILSSTFSHRCHCELNDTSLGSESQGIYEPDGTFNPETFFSTIVRLGRENHLRKRVIVS